MKHRPPQKPATLRSAAEARLEKQPAIVEQEPVDDVLRLRHELEVHQVELEMQNEQLQAAQEEIQAGLDRYMDLFDSAPIGLLNLTVDGTIKLANISAARLLGTESDRLRERCLGSFITEEERPTFNQFMKEVFATSTQQTCELGFLVEGALSRTVQMTAVRFSFTPECRVVLRDITERKLAERKIHDQLNELQRWHNLMLAREGRVLELKTEVNELLAQQGLPARYADQANS